MAGKKRVRDVPIYVWVRPDELEAIRERMDEAGVRNMSTYIRKMALNGYILHVDLAPCPGACFPPAVVCQQFEPGGDPRQQLRGVPGGDQGPAKRLCRAVGAAVRSAG